MTQEQSEFRIEQFSGYEIGKLMLSIYSLNEVRILLSSSNFYNINARIVYLTSNVYNGNNSESHLIALHECGHAVQHNNRISKILLLLYFPLIGSITRILVEIHCNQFVFKTLNHLRIPDYYYHSNILKKSLYTYLFRIGIDLLAFFWVFLKFIL